MTQGTKVTQNQIEGHRREKSNIVKKGKHQPVRQQVRQGLIVNASLNDLLPYAIIVVLGGIIQFFI